MITVLIDGASPLADDGFVLDALQRAALRSPLFGASVMIGIRNEDGEIYRLVQCQGSRQTARVTERIRSLGFRRESTIGQQYHYLFSR